MTAERQRRLKVLSIPEKPKEALIKEVIIHFCMLTDRISDLIVHA